VALRHGDPHGRNVALAWAVPTGVIMTSAAKAAVVRNKAFIAMLLIGFKEAAIPPLSVH
jgi:hypothetical protein